MPEYATKIVDSYETPDRGNPLTPHTSTLFKTQESTKLQRGEQESFHNTVMRIMFYAIRVRPDILSTVNFLFSRTRLGTASQEDKEKLIRLVQFIRNTSANGITLGYLALWLTVFEPWFLTLALVPATARTRLSGTVFTVAIL